MVIFIQAAELFFARWQQTPPPGKEGQQVVQSLYSLIPVIAAIVGLLVLIALIGLLMRRSQTGKRQPASGNAPSASRATRLLPREEQPAGWLILPDGRPASLTALPVNIGSDPSSQVVIAGPTVAPLHARICQDELEHVLYIEDPSGGSNLLLLNGKPTRKNLLKANDEITLGAVVLHYQPAVPVTSTDPKG